MNPAARDKSPAPGGGLLFPAPAEGWEYWEGPGKPQAVKDEGASNLRRVEWAALPAAAVGNFVMPAASGDAAALRQAANLRAERLRLKKENASPALIWSPVGANGKNDSVFVEVLDEAVPDAVANTSALHYAASPHLLPLPANGCALWREHGKLALAVTREGALTYFATLPVPEKEDALRQELVALKHQLEFRGLFPAKDAQGFNWEALPDASAAALAVLPGTWKTEPRPAPRAPTGGEIVPVAVAQERHAAARRQRTRRILLGVAAAYAAILLVWTAVLMSRRSGNRALEDKLAQTADEVSHLQATARDWGQLLPALDNHYYPLTLLQEVYEIMPADGEIRLEVFSLKDRAIELRGQAANVDQVFRFHRQLAAQPDLQQFQWSLDNPAIQPDGSATFRVVGRP